MTQDLSALLRGNAYPGRGILLGSLYRPGANAAVIAYFIMGRSENSRNRVFEETADGIRTKAFDESRMTDPSLIIYHPVRVVKQGVIVTNGDQTDTIRDYLKKGECYVCALRTREYEPDRPNFTPRISGILKRHGDYCLSILKHQEEEGCCRQFFEYSARAGAGHFISTYQGDGEPLPSFAGEPVKVDVAAPNAPALAEELWSAMNEENKVSLFVQYIDLRSGLTDTVIVNKHTGTTHTKGTASIWH